MNQTVIQARTPTNPNAPADYDVAQVRAQFPILNQHVNGRRLAYLDNAATTQKPQRVIDAINNYYCHDNANVHRAIHALSQRATAGYEGTRDQLRDFLNAAKREEIVYTRGTTDAINLVAQSFARPRLRNGDEILVSGMEHHSNIVPWQLACEATGASLKVLPINDAGELHIELLEEYLSDKTKLVALGHVSNALGTINPVERVIAAAHARDIPVLLDGAQAVGHLTVDVQALDVDFYALSAHKMYGPTGIGALYSKQQWLEEMPPYQGGGDMIDTVTFEGSTWNEVPYKFEAGTPNIAGAVGWGAAISFLDSFEAGAIAAHEHRLLAKATAAMEVAPGLQIIGTAANKSAIISWVMEGAHPHDIGAIMDQVGVAIRTGHHCAMPLMQRFGVPATARASFACYNDDQDVEALIEGVTKTHKLLG